MNAREFWSSSIGRVSLSLCSVGLLLFLGLANLLAADSKSSQIEKASHRQTRVIEPKLNNRSVTLNTFCVSSEGEILAACKNGSGQAVVLVYDAEGNLTENYEAPFNATAINTSQDGKVFIAGEGRIAKLLRDGTVELEVDSPNIGDAEEYRQRALEGAKQMAKQYSKVYEDQTEAIRKRIAALEEKPADELSKVDQARLKAYQQQLVSYEQMTKQMTSRFNVESMIASSKRITSIAVSANDVFICCGNLDGPGYAVWRTDHDFKNAKEVLTGLRGCCGQMDVQCCGDQLVVAQNTAFKVGLYDRDGKEVISFGSGDRSSENGFGSCCNPMNVRTMPDGTILAAESSIGHIKRFKQDGTFVEYVGRARIGGGCKHCAMGYDPKSEQFYMMHQDTNQICVLTSLSSSPEGAEEDKSVAALRDKFDGRLLGTWELGEQKPGSAKKSSSSGVFGLLGGLLGRSATTANTPFESMVFQADGSLKVKGGRYATYGNKWTWRPVEDNAGTLEISLEADQIEVSTLKVSFGAEHQAKFAVNIYGSNVGTTLGRRTLTCDGKKCGEECKDVEPVDLSKIR